VEEWKKANLLDAGDARLRILVVGSYRLDSDADAPSDAPPGSLVATLEKLIVGSSRSSKTGGE
jgi:hypothetical protein